MESEVLVEPENIPEDDEHTASNNKKIYSNKRKCDQMENQPPAELPPQRAKQLKRNIFKRMLQLEEKMYSSMRQIMIQESQDADYPFW